MYDACAQPSRGASKLENDGPPLYRIIRSDENNGGAQCQQRRNKSTVRSLRCKELYDFAFRMVRNRAPPTPIDQPLALHLIGVLRGTRALVVKKSDHRSARGYSSRNVALERGKPVQGTYPIAADDVGKFTFIPGQM